jgi:hypothetical protein
LWQGQGVALSQARAVSGKEQGIFQIMLTQQLSLETPSPAEHASFTDADAAVAYLEELYTSATGFLIGAFNGLSVVRSGPRGFAPSTLKSGLKPRAMTRSIRV